MNWEYVRISPRRSWHVVLTPTRMFDTYRTLCGRTVVSRDITGELPGDQKTCERCLLVSVRRTDHANDEPEELPETKTDPAGEDDPAMPFEPTVTSP